MVSFHKIPPSAHKYRTYGSNKCNFHTYRSDSTMVTQHIELGGSWVLIPRSAQKDFWVVFDFECGGMDHLKYV